MDASDCGLEWMDSFVSVSSYEVDISDFSSITVWLSFRRLS